MYCVLCECVVIPKFYSDLETMYSLKVEFDKNNHKCHGCLSTDRHPALLKTNLDIFFYLLGTPQQYCDTKVMLCWECRALLNKIQTFQNRIQQAQFILQQSLYNLENIQVNNLSNLTTIKKDYYDYTVEHEEKLEENITVDETKEIIDSFIKQETDDTQENNDIVYEEFKLEDDNDDSNTSIDNYHSVKKYKYKREKYSLKQYLNKAKIDKTDIDLSDSRKYCKTVYLDDKEIEEIVERDRVKLNNESLRFKCENCLKSYKKKIDYKRHYTFNHMNRSGRLKCVVCRKYIPSWEGLKRHWNRHNMYYACTICGWAAKAAKTVSTHQRRTHLYIYTCMECNVQYKTLREFCTHYKKTHERIICDHCGKTFVKKRTLEIHMKRHHLPATCNICNRTYSHYHVLENHYRLNHPHLIRGQTNTELSYCVECDKQFASVYKYRRHLTNAAKHTPPKPVSIPCPECGKVFARKVRMTNHYRSVHINDSKHRCDICNKSFCSAYSARTHRQCVHEKIPMPKNKMCDICGRGFSTNRILTNHRRTHTGERPFACAHCPATFAQRTAMRTHEKTQHKNANIHTNVAHGTAGEKKPQGYLQLSILANCSSGKTENFA